MFFKKSCGIIVRLEIVQFLQVLKISIMVVNYGQKTDSEKTNDGLFYKCRP